MQVTKGLKEDLLDRNVLRRAAGGLPDPYLVVDVLIQKMKGNGKVGCSRRRSNVGELKEVIKIGELNKDEAVEKQKKVERKQNDSEDEE